MLSDVYAILAVGARVLAESVSERECCSHQRVPTPDCRSFRGLLNWRASCSRAGFCYICRYRCCGTDRITGGDSATLVRRHRAEMEGPSFRV
uniref:Uncharacterized protein n=1 Tax=Ixodes ricinus TaxID=34613 RepID=A0A6B0U1P9_IXORI